MAGLDAVKLGLLSLDVRRARVLKHAEAPGLRAGDCLGNRWLLLRNDLLFAPFAAFASLAGGWLLLLGWFGWGGCGGSQAREVHNVVYID